MTLAQRNQAAAERKAERELIKQRRKQERMPAKPLDPAQVAAQGRQFALENIGLTQQQLGSLLPQFSQAARGEVDYFANRLDNQYTRDARTAIMGDMGQTPIETELANQAQQELALGRSLSPEQQRDATQSARAAFAARGMATGNPAIGAELLMRDRFADARQQQRRQFAGGVAELMNAGARRRQLGAGMLAELDPYSRAIAPGTAVGQNVLGMGLNTIGGNLQQMQGMAGNAATFNINRQDSLYNAFLNRQAAIQAANMQASAAGQAGTMGMIGAGVGTAVGVAGIGIAI